MKDPWAFEGAFCDYHTLDSDDHRWKPWTGGDVIGENTSEYEIYDNLSPVMHIEAPSKEWRDRFMAENMNGTVHELIVMTHPVFSGYAQWKEPRDFVSGYHLQNEYESDDLCQYTIDQLAERGIIKGMDMIIWRLCKHFGFGMRK